jgi:polysaccharide export outer membrane protein
MSIHALSYAALAAILVIAAHPPIAQAATPQPVSAQPASADASASPSAAGPNQGYILGPQDVVEVDVLGQADFKVRAPVAADGSIELPYIGKVTAANKTTAQLSEDITHALVAGGYYSHPILSIEIVAYASRYVTVLGEVGAPGLVPIDRSYRLSEVLARVGGTKEGAADYVIVRSPNGPERHYAINGLATGAESDDPLVAPGDKIFSPHAALFYISGEVKAPGAYPLMDGMTLRMAVGRGGGLTDLGTEHGIKVRDASGKAVQLGLDDKIEAGEVIVVGERLF